MSFFLFDCWLRSDSRVHLECDTKDNMRELSVMQKPRAEEFKHEAESTLGLLGLAVWDHTTSVVLCGCTEYRKTGRVS